MTTDASIEEEKDTTRLSERLQRRRRRCFYGQLEVSTMTTAALEE